MSTREANPGSGVGVETACVDCLRRSWLLGRLGSWIQNVVDDRAGRRTPELLRLESSDLVQVVAAKKADHGRRNARLACQRRLLVLLPA